VGEIIESDLSDNIERRCSPLSQFCYGYKVALAEDRFVVDTSYYISI